MPPELELKGQFPKPPELLAYVDAATVSAAGGQRPTVLLKLGSNTLLLPLPLIWCEEREWWTQAYSFGTRPSRFASLASPLGLL